MVPSDWSIRHPEKNGEPDFVSPAQHWTTPHGCEIFADPQPALNLSPYCMDSALGEMSQIESVVLFCPPNPGDAATDNSRAGVTNQPHFFMHPSPYWRLW
jgi:hypothetical protein